MAKGPLEKLRVVLIGNAWAGPLCAASLGDMGAEVIRLESRARVDPYRLLWVKDEQNIEKGPFFQVVNRNTLSVTLNMSHPRARELAKAIIGISDILVENYAPTTLRRWGLDYPSVRQINPSIIMASISGYGQSGPLSSQSAYGPASMSLSGLAWQLGYEGEEPLGMLTPYNDPLAGLVGLFSIMAALHYRARTGRGQYIDISQLESVAAMMGVDVLDYTMNGRVASSQGNRSSWMAPHGCYRCKGEDKWITIACATQEEWRAFCQATGNQHLLNDERFVDNYARLTNRKELDKIIEEWTSRRIDYEVMELLQQAGVAAAPVFTLAELFTDPHAQEEEYFVHLPHPEEPGGYVYNIPWQLSRTPGEIRSPAPLMGEHNEYVLCELCGIPKDEFQSLVEEKVIW